VSPFFRFPSVRTDFLSKKCLLSHWIGKIGAKTPFFDPFFTKNHVFSIFDFKSRADSVLGNEKVQKTRFSLFSRKNVKKGVKTSISRWYAHVTLGGDKNDGFLTFFSIFRRSLGG
jgi:hypothetical protein